MINLPCFFYPFFHKSMLWLLIRSAGTKNVFMKKMNKRTMMILYCVNRFAYLLFAYLLLQFQPSSLPLDFRINFIALPPSGHVFLTHHDGLN